MVIRRTFSSIMSSHGIIHNSAIISGQSHFLGIFNCFLNEFQLLNNTSCLIHFLVPKVYAVSTPPDLSNDF